MFLFLVSASFLKMHQSLTGSHSYLTNKMDFTVPKDVSPELDLLLTRLAKDFHDGYLTEKGYIKKRMELLGVMASGTSETHTETTTEGLQTTNTRQSASTSDRASEDFFRASHTISHSVDES